MHVERRCSGRMSCAPESEEVVSTEDAFARLYGMTQGDRGGLVVAQRVLHRGEQIDIACVDA